MPEESEKTNLQQAKQWRPRLTEQVTARIEAIAEKVGIPRDSIFDDVVIKGLAAKEAEVRTYPDGLD